MTKKDKEKTAFHTKEGVFYYTKMPFGLKNTGATYQRLVDSAFKEQIGVNLEAYVDDMVIKSRTEQDIIKDIEQTFSTIRRINMKINPKKCSFGIEEGKFMGYIVILEGIRANPEKIKAVMDMPSPRTLKQVQSLNTLKKCTNKKDFRWTEAAEATFLEINKLVSELPTLTTSKKGKTLMMYLAAANEAVSTVLLTEKDRRQMPIHYVSRSLNGVETNYAPMEKLALALVYAAKRLRRYFQAHLIKVITDSLIGQGLNNSGASRRLTKWAIKLGAYGITYVPRAAVKGLVLADFLADTSTEINATSEVASTPRMEDILESLNAREYLTPGPRAWRLYTDGSSNNGGFRVGLILIAPDDVEYSYALRLNFSNSNNDAEYKALLAGLRITTEMQVKDIHAFVDSKLFASQVEGSYEAKGERMIKYQERVLELAGAFNRFRITHIPRAENRKAGALLANWQRIRPGLDDSDLKLSREGSPARRPCMEIIEPLSKGPGRAKYLIVATNYLTKWTEAKPLATITGKQVVNFTWDNIVCRFGIPATINIDNGTQFGNGAVERANRSLLRGIKTRLEKGGSTWAEEVPNVLWAHRIMKKTSNGATPFSLTYGTEAVIPAEIGMPTHRTSNLNEKTNDQELRLNLDLLEERREIAAISEASYKQQVEKYYNKKVRHVQFKVGEFVLRKNEASRAANTGKLGPT
ncbi:reverse transcriptase domain-containing protein [Tanacetum coccineum]